MNWTEFYLGLTLAVAQKSKDTTKHGCIITNQRHKILGLGYNGFPTGFPDEEMPTIREGTPNKYDLTIHAEVNAANNCTSRIKNGIAYVSGIACNPCILHLYQNGVRDIYMIDKTSNMLNDRTEEVYRFIERAGLKSKYGRLGLYRVKPNLHWLTILGNSLI